MKGHIEEKVKDERLQRLQALILDQQHQFLQSKIGQRIEVLVEKVGRHEGQMVGRSPWLLPVAVSTNAKIGEIIAADVTDASSNSLLGRAVN